jgi:hypothetical protein
MLIVYILIVDVILAWNQEAHRIISRIATDEMSRKAMRFIRDTLGATQPGWSLRRQVNAKMMDVSGWADTVESSAHLHFAFTPFRHCQPFVIERDCGFGETKGECIVTAIARFIDQASEYGKEKDEARNDALRYLIHLVGDIHQPLHMGFQQDGGGNKILLKEPAELSLHEVWDSFLLKSLRSRQETQDVPFSRILQYVKTNAGQLETGSLDLPSIDIATMMASDTTTRVTCNEAYKDASNWIKRMQHSLSDEYIKARGQVVVDQLNLAGRRLRLIIEKIATEYYANERRFVNSRSPALGSLAADAATAEAAHAPSNRYGTFNIDFDANELINEDLLVPEEDDILDEGPRQTEDTRVDKPEADNEDEDGASLEPFPSKAKKNRRRRQLGKQREAKKKQAEAESKVILFKRATEFYMSTSGVLQANGGETYIPPHCYIFDFGSNPATSLSIRFDRVAFPQSYRPRVVAQILKDFGVSVVEIGEERVDLRAQLPPDMVRLYDSLFDATDPTKVMKGEPKSSDTILDYTSMIDPTFKSHLHQLVSIKLGESLQFITRLDWLTRSAVRHDNRRWVLNVYPTVREGGKKILTIADARIADLGSGTDFFDANKLFNHEVNQARVERIPQNVPIMGALYALSRFLDGLAEEIDALVIKRCLESITEVIREPGETTFEYITKVPKGMRFSKREV